MNSITYEYVRAYILKNYPMYSNKILVIRNSFLKFLVDSIHQEYDSRALNQGEADEKIDQLINNHIRDNFKEMFDSFNDLCEHIKNISIKQYSFWADMMTDDLLNDIVKKVALGVIKSDDVEYSEYMDGSYDQKFLASFEKYSKKFYNTGCNHIKNVLVDNDVDRRYSESTYNYLVDLVMVEMIKENSIKNIEKGLYDNIIISKYMKALKKARSDVKKYINDLIYEKEFLFGVSMDDLFKHIEYEIFTTGKFNIEDLLNGELDSYIVDRVKTKKKPINIEDIRTYVLQIIKRENTFNLHDGELCKIANQILDILLNNKCNLRLIQIGRHDSEIKSLFNRIMMKRMSVIDNKAPEKIKHKTKKRKCLLSLKSLIIIALCTGILISGTYFVSEVSDTVNYTVASETVDDFDDFKYYLIYSPDNDMVIPTAINCLDFYNNVKDLGIDEDIYCYLGFHNAYVSIAQDKLYVMDELFSWAQIRASGNSLYQEVYEEIKYNDCFLDFVIQRLNDMGCKEIKKDKYLEALEAYKQAKRNNKDEKAMDVISDEHAKVIEKIMDMYGDYCRKATVKFSNLLPEIQESTKKIDYGAGRKM